MMAADGLTNPGLTAEQVAAQMTATAAQRLAYLQIGDGPQTTGANTSSLLGGTAFFGNGNSGARPYLSLGYVGASYATNLHGSYGLAAVSPGNVIAILLLGATTWQQTIGNLVAGTPGSWWDASADIVCTALSGMTATVKLGATITFQAAGGVTAAVAVGRTEAAKTITLDSQGRVLFDLQRTFTNANNTMTVETLKIEQVR